MHNSAQPHIAIETVVPMNPLPQTRALRRTHAHTHKAQVIEISPRLLLLVFGDIRRQEKRRVRKTLVYPPY
jgi:hypothetical protein